MCGTSLKNGNNWLEICSDYRLVRWKISMMEFSKVFLMGEFINDVTVSSLYRLKFLMNFQWKLRDVLKVKLKNKRPTKKSKNTQVKISRQPFKSPPQSG
jgi:hypothetical protein